MHRCTFSDRLEFIRGELVRTVRAEYGKGTRILDVYREYESGYTECRNLYLSVYGGYYVGFPGEPNSYYRSGSCVYIEKLDEWGECNCPGMNNHSDPIKQIEKEIIIEHYPAFKYVLNKWSGSIHNVLYVLNIWKDHPEVEMLLAAGFKNLVFNTSFWKLSESKRKEIVLYVRQHNLKNYSLVDIQTILKYKLTIPEFVEYHKFCVYEKKCRYDIFRYLQKIKMADYRGVELYQDYTKLLKQTDHNIKDSYWMYPKNLQAKHDQVREEIERIEEIKTLEKLMEKQEAYYKVIKRKLKYNCMIDGYSVFIPDNVAEINRQASRLHQCLITADYISKVINKQCVLVFIQKDGEPVATAQILKGNKIGQFYADELDRSNCLPTDEVRKVLNKWIELKEAA